GPDRSGGRSSSVQVKTHQAANPRNTSPMIAQRTVRTTRRYPKSPGLAPGTCSGMSSRDSIGRSASGGRLDGECPVCGTGLQSYSDRILSYHGFAAKPTTGEQAQQFRNSPILKDPQPIGSPDLAGLATLWPETVGPARLSQGPPATFRLSRRTFTA